MNKTVNANPTKEFFVNMLVRDIMLKQAITELVDNSIDGARALRKDNQFDGLRIRVTFDDNTFEIADNCGGISLEAAVNYAFRFGRPKMVNQNNTETTGIFGIGMKRALFKMGNNISVHSVTSTSEFQLDIDVSKWLNKDDNNWDFELSSSEDGMDNPEEKTGTTIIITDLYNEISAEFKDKDFQKEVIDHIGRRTGLDIVHGIVISVNEENIYGNNISLINNDQIKPIKVEYTDKEDVKVKIIGGIAPKDEKSYPPEQAGWYIYCNGRLIVSADKTSLTTWKDMENKSSGVVFHNNYAPFRGIVYFNSIHPDKLPWNTTKTGIDETSLVYLRAREKMFDVFNIVKNTLDEIRRNSNEKDDGIESTIAEMPGTEMTTENVEKITENKTLNIKDINVTTEPKVNISYKKSKKEVDKVKEMLEVDTNREVGEKTFEYYIDAEC